MAISAFALAAVLDLEEAGISGDVDECARALAAGQKVNQKLKGVTQQLLIHCVIVADDFSRSLSATIASHSLTRVDIHHL